VSPAAIPASLTTPSTDARTKNDWSKSGVTFSSLGRRDSVVGSISRIWATMSSVLTLPCLRTDRRTDFLPATWTMLVCGA